MYIPDHFKEVNQQRISSLIEEYPFGMLITVPNGAPFISHLPFLFDRSAGSHGKLLGHIARANPQWQHLEAGEEALAVFQGPHAYISPTWYSSPGVPTWNYAVVHVRGKALLIETESELEALVEKLTHVHESLMPNPWKPNLSGERRSKLLKMIVGFEIEISNIEGKFKLSQNRPHEDKQRVISELEQSNNQTEIAVANLMSWESHDEL